MNLKSKLFSSGDTIPSDSRMSKPQILKTIYFFYKFPKKILCNSQLHLPFFPIFPLLLKKYLTNRKKSYKIYK